MKLNFKKNKNLDTFRKALTLPIIIVLLCIISPVKVKKTLEWLEFKTLDILFAYYPFICEFSFIEPQQNSPTVIITKDQTFQKKFNKSPDRVDFANLLDELKKQGVKVAAFDYIYDEPSKNEEEDKAFIQKLEEFPYPILGQNILEKGLATFNQINYYEKDKQDYTSGLIPLHKPIAEKALTKGLININSDLDFTIRYAPLGYQLNPEKNIFTPSLGFSSYVVSLLAEKEDNLNKIDLSKAKDIFEAFDIINSHAPYDFHTIGHSGLDGTISDLEVDFLYRFITRKYPNLKTQNDIKKYKREKRGNKRKTWVKLPEQPLPIIGSYNMPSIRLPFQKLKEPLKGDGIKTLSMTQLLVPDEEESSSLLFGKKQLDLLADKPIQMIRPQIPKPITGQNSFFGEIRKLNGESIINAKILAVMPQTGYWEKTTTDSKGQYNFTNIPNGDFVIIVFLNAENGYDKAMFSFKIENEKDKKLPLLLLDNNINKVEIPSSVFPSNNDAEVIIYGEVNPMFCSDKDGNTIIKSIPDGFVLSKLNAEDEVYESVDEDLEDDSDELTDNNDTEKLSIDENGKLLLNNKIYPNGIIAVTSEEVELDKYWQLYFYRRIPLKQNQNLTINNLPSSLDSKICVKCKSIPLITKEYNELEIKPGTLKCLTKLPRPYLDLESKVNLKVSFSNINNNSSNSVNLEEAKVVLISDSGKEYEIKNEKAIDISDGKYTVLTQVGNLKGLHCKELVSEKTVFLGTTLLTDQDFVVTPINFLDIGFNRIAGIHIHANLFAALKNNVFLYEPPFHIDRAPLAWPIYQFLLFLPIAILLNLFLKDAKTTKSTLIILLTIFIIYLLSVILFPRRIIIPVFFPCLLIISFGISKSFIEWINFRRLANETQSAFSRFISADVVSQIVNNPDAIKPGGEKKELTIMFTDIAGFTSISEKLDAEALTDLMNNYLDEMTKILFKNGGTLDKYVGDAIMGFWNHPTPQEDHATRAVTCAIEMQKKLKEMREKWMAQGLPKVEMRAGINSGICMVGFIGSTIQMNFTCLGDNVNLASRLEGANKAYGTFIMVSDAVKKQLNPYLFSIRFLDFLAVKGKNEPVLVYEIRGFLNEENPLWLEKAGKIYQEGIDKYLTREWDNAIALFNQVLELFPDDSPSKVYIDRCEHFKENPPEEKWDGRFILKTK